MRIGDSRLAAHISWKYYQWNNYLPDPYQLNYGGYRQTDR